MSSATISQSTTSTRMRALMQLVALDIPRSPVIWFVLPLLVIVWVLGRDTQPEGLVLWTVASATVGMISVIISPIVAGLFAWIGQGIHRNNVEPLLHSQPSAGISHGASVLLTGTSWMLFGIGLYLVYQMYLLIRYATFGFIDAAPVVMGISILLAATTVGFSIGTVSGKVWSPLLAAAVFALFQIGLPLLLPFQSLRYLSGVPFLGSRSGGVLADYWAAVASPFIAWMLGLAGIAVALTMLTRERTAVLYGLFAVTAVFALGGAAKLVSLPSDFYAIPREHIAWEPQCREALTLDLAVCVHPAYMSTMDQTMEVASAVWEPVAGLAGVPSRIEQFPEDTLGDPPLPIYFESNGHEYLAVEYAIAATNGISSTPQAIVAMWLAAQSAPVSDELVMSIAVRLSTAGEGSGSDGGSSLFLIRDQLLADMEFFAALDPGERRAWLDVNWTSLRAGELDAEDMPIT